MAQIPDGVDDLDALTAAARRVLLDVLFALQVHRHALVLVGAQAVHLRSMDAPFAVAAYTSDADLGVDPDRLGDEPHLEHLLQGAGFALRHQDGPGLWVREDVVAGVTVPVEVDLLVPASLVSGRRAARLPPHANNAARQAEGLELALHDSDLLTVHGLGDDRREFAIAVAGVAALLTAKAHKLSDRLAGARERLSAKDAADVYRLMITADPYLVADRFQTLLDDPATTAPTDLGLGLLLTLFGGARTAGTDLAVQALTAGGPSEAEIRTLAPTFVAALPHGTRHK